MTEISNVDGHVVVIITSFLWTDTRSEDPVNLVVTWNHTVLQTTSFRVDLM